MDIARSAVLAAGWPTSVPGVTIDRQCGSSQQAVHFAAAGLIAGQYDVVVAGGVESMSRIPMGSTLSSGGSPFTALGWRERYGDVIPHQGVGAEMVAKRWNLTRRQLDEYSLASHEKAAAAQDAGLAAEQIVPVPSSLTGGATASVDEGVRRGGTLDALGALRPAFAEDGVITAGNSSQISDGAAALLMTTSERAAQLGLRPLARIHTAVLAADDPVIMLTAPLLATRKILARSGLRLDEIGAFEVNEAFASVPLAWLADIADGDAGVEKALNPNGGAIALGHPLGASGARAMTSVVHHLHANGIRYGLQTMCEGGGQANAVIVERL